MVRALAHNAEVLDRFPKYWTSNPQNYGNLDLERMLDAEQAGIEDIK